MLLLLLVAATPAESPATPAESATPAVPPATRQPEPPKGTLSARMAWLAEHAPLTLPREGCAWLPAAPGCARPAWVCVAPWSWYGSGGGTFGANATFGEDPAVKAAWTLEAPSYAEDLELGHTSTDGARLAIKRGEEGFGAPVYESCIQSFGPTAADRCEAEARAVAHSTETTCTIVLADACTGHVGLRCEGGRYHTVPVTMDPTDEE